MASSITSDLFSIATSGVNASNQLLQTTSSNIANLNTEGYIRQSTTFVSQVSGGVGQGTTARVIDLFTQNQLRRDITTVGELAVYEDKINSIDNILASEANSLATGLSEFFASIQTAADDPSSIVSRSTVFNEANQFLSQVSTISEFLESEEEELNQQFDDSINQANSLIQSIGDLNQAILVAEGNNSDQEPSALLNQRDSAINALAELVSIEIRDGAGEGNTLNVSLTSGESLVLDNGSFNLLALGSSADNNTRELQLTTSFENKNNTVINVSEDNLGGSIGGLFRFRDEVLGVAQRDIGQLAIAFGDAVNEQNGLGLDLDQQLGGDIFELPDFAGLPFDDTDGDLGITGRFTPGQGTSVTDSDIKITVTSVDGSNQPDEITIEFLEGNGEATLGADNQPIVFTNVSVTSGFNEIEGGIEIEFDSSKSYSIDNEFLLQPTKFAGSDIALATTRPEDLAFALPIRVTPDANNFGDLSVVSTVVTNTTVGTGSDRSGFDGLNDIDDVASSPSTTVGAPERIVFDSSSQFTVFDSADNVITVVTGVNNYENLLEQAQNNGASPAWPTEFSALDDYPGYDVTLEGEPQPGDSFSFEYNEGGLDDNRNAGILSNLQESALVQLSSESTNQPRTLHEAYSSLVGEVGSLSANADISLQAAEALQTQSSQSFASVSGVSLDEEAANLVRFQQSYSASAQILATAQTLFDTILSIVR